MLVESLASVDLIVTGGEKMRIKGLITLALIFLSGMVSTFTVVKCHEVLTTPEPETVCRDEFGRRIDCE